MVVPYPGECFARDKWQRVQVCGGISATWTDDAARNGVNPESGIRTLGAFLFHISKVFLSSCPFLGLFPSA